MNSNNKNSSSNAKKIVLSFPDIKIFRDAGKLHTQFIKKDYIKKPIKNLYV